MNIDDYREYISAETMMGPNCVRILAELFEKYRRSVKMRTIFLLKKSSSARWSVSTLTTILREVKDFFRKKFCRFWKMTEWF